MEYTREQLDAAQAFIEHKSLRIKAFAGSGKTTVLSLMAERDRRQGLYLAYNNEIARESRDKFPRNVVCKTAHALALGNLPTDLREKAARGNYLDRGQLVHFLNRRVGLSEVEANEVSWVAAKAMHWFCVSDDPEPALHHVQKALDDTYVSVDPESVVTVLPAMWEAITSAGGCLPLIFDGYLKLFQLSGAPLPFDYILADECQDMYPAIQWIIRNSGAQVVWVGDPSQQIYDFNGAENVMCQLDDLETYRLTMSFRFGDWLAELVQPLLTQLGESDLIRGNPDMETRRAMRTLSVKLARSNATLLSPLVSAIRADKKVHVLGGVDKLRGLLNSAERVMRKRPVSSGLFAGLCSWHEARERASDRGNRALREIVELIDIHRLREVRRCVDSVCPEEEAHIVLSTVHQAKGREFSKVAILDDFRKKPEFLMTFRGKDIYAPAPEMLRLLYVALTRAEHELFVPMSLARRYGIAEELKNEESRARASAPDTVDEPIDPLNIERTPEEESQSHTYDYSPAPRRIRTPAPFPQLRHTRESCWDRWSMRLIILVGIMASSILLDYKGYIDLKSLAEYVGEKLFS